MRPPSHKTLDRWLAAERDDRFDEADAALLELFEALPSIAPPAGFAERVLARAGFQPAAKRDFFASRGLRLVLAVCLVVTVLGTLWLPPVLRALAGLWSLSDVVEGGTRALTEGTQVIASVLRVWDFLFALGRTLAEALAAPQIAAVLTLSLLASGLAFRFLRDQISGERNLTYVDPN